MFSSNQKISIRQIQRMLILDLFGAGSLILPGLLAKTVGKDGIFSIAAGAVLAFIYVWFLGTVQNRIQGDYYTWLKKKTGGWIADAVMLFYFFFFLLMAAFLLEQLAGLVQAWLLPDSSRYVISVLVLVLAGFAAAGGIEGRARVYEIMFWFLGFFLILMLFLAAGDVNTGAWAPVGTAAPGAFLNSTVCVFSFFLPLNCLLFLKPHCARPEKLRQCAKGVVLVVAVLYIVIYLILLGIFQEKTTAVLERPVITLMSMVKLPGGFVTRMDAFMTAIWFFSLFSLMNTGVFYSNHILKEVFHEKRTCYGLLAVLVLVFFIARCYYVYPQAIRIYSGYIRYLALPVLVLLPVLFFCGCRTTELENRDFPLAMGIDKSPEGLEVSYDLPELKKGTAVCLTAQAGSYLKARKVYENNSSRVLDHNHLKAIVISQEFLSDRDALRELLSCLEKEEVVARNTYLFAAKEKASDILGMSEKIEGSVGEYLEQMIKTQKDFKDSKIVTIGDLMNQWHNQNEVLLIPVLTEEDSRPQVTAYAVMDAFTHRGSISAEDAMKAFLCRGQLKTFLYRMKGGTEAEIREINVKTEFTKEGEQVIVSVILTGKAKLQETGKEQVSEKKLQELLNQQLQEDLTETAQRLRKEPGMDLTDSFLGMCAYDRSLYQEYGGDYDGYRQQQETAFLVELKLINE